MARRKVKLAFITNDAKRKATYNKRKSGLLKMARELCALCDIIACAIIYSPYETQPEIWPNVSQAHQLLSRLKGMSHMQRNQKMVNQESYIMQRIVKAKEQLKKQMEKNREKEMKKVMYRCLIGAGVENFDLGELNHLGKVMDKNLKEISKKIELLTIGEGSKNEDVVIVGEQNTNVSFGVEVITQQFNDSVSLQTWEMDFGGEMEMMLPFGDNIATWSGGMFP